VHKHIITTQARQQGERNGFGILVPARKDHSVTAHYQRRLIHRESLFQPTLVAPEYDPKDGSYSYFGGDFKTWNIPNDKPGKFTSQQLFKAGSPHTVSLFRETR
jgi:hypothetical protein